MTQSYDTSAVFTQVYLLKTDTRLAAVFMSVFASLRAKFPVQIYGWTEIFKQVQRRYLKLDSD